MAKQAQRLRRQFELIARTVPGTRGPIRGLLEGRFRMIRLPVAGLLLLGGVFSFLPVLGIWMLPLGLMLLAVDFPFLSPPVSGTVIRGRRRFSVWRRSAVARLWPRRRPK